MTTVDNHRSVFQKLRFATATRATSAILMWLLAAPPVATFIGRSPMFTAKAAPGDPCSNEAILKARSRRSRQPLSHPPSYCWPERQVAFCCTPCG